MNEINIGSVLVMEGDDVAGIFTERDLLRKIIGDKRDPMTTPIADIMTPRANMIFVKPDTTVSVAMQIMTEKRVRHLPVMHDGKVEGLVSIGDLTKWVIMDQKKEISSLTDYISGQY